MHRLQELAASLIRQTLILGGAVLALAHCMSDGSSPGQSTETRSVAEADPTAPVTSEPSVPVSLSAGEPVRSVRQRVVPTGFSYEIVLDELDQATCLAFLPDNRMLIGQKGGLVRVAAFEGGAWTLRDEPFVDLEDETNEALDRGLLSIAVHPDFPDPAWVYIYHAWDPPGLPGNADEDGSRVARVLRFTADAGADYEVAADEGTVFLGAGGGLDNIGDVTDWNSETLLSCQGAPDDPHDQDCIPNDSNNHAGAMLAFGQDGSLFFATGDATPPNGNTRAIRSQHLDSLAGKLLRVDPETGAGLPDNPFYDGDPDSNRSKVYSYGLRNPFRIAIHPDSGEVYIGDVGWNSWEELNVGVGLNFGWPCYEGNDEGSLVQESYSDLPECVTLYDEGDSAVEPPLFAYEHDPPGEFGASIILGDFYTGSIYPEAYQGALFFYDFNDTWMDSVSIDGGNVSRSEFGTMLGGENDYSNGIVHMTRGPDSNLYTANLTTVRRLVYTEGNTPPLAVATATPEYGSVPLDVQFDGTESSDPDGGTLIYEWEFGDGTTSGSASPTHTYDEEGVYDVLLRVTDPQGASATDTVRIFPGNEAPVLTIAEPTAGTSFVVGQQIDYSGSAVDPDSGDLSDEIEWEVLLHHNDHTHFNVHSSTGPSGSFEVEDHGELNWHLEVCAQVTDEVGLVVRECRELEANSVEYCFETSPPRLELSAGGAQRQTPFIVDAIVNSGLLISAPTEQSGASFVEWVHGGDRNQTLDVGSESASFQAVYSGGAEVEGDGPATCAELFAERASDEEDSDGGCSCRLLPARGTGWPWPLLLGSAALLAWVRRRVSHRRVA